MTKILLILSILALSACKQDYSLGDASLLYCNSTSQAGRDTLRTVLNVLGREQGINIGIDYCKTFETLKNGYQLGDVTEIYCNATDNATRNKITTVFVKELELDSVALSASYCEVIK